MLKFMVKEKKGSRRLAQGMGLGALCPVSWADVQSYALTHPQVSIAALVVVIAWLEWVKAGFKPKRATD